MPIKFSFKKLPVDADGKAHDSLEAFQAAQILKLLGINSQDTAEDIVEHKAEMIEILELTMDSRPSARGIKKPRKAKASSDQQPELADQLVDLATEQHAALCERR